MNLTKNMKNNLDVLLSIALNAHYTNIHIDNVELINETFMCNFTRSVSINHLKKVNDYFGTNIRNKKLAYSLIVNKNTNTIKLSIEGIENLQLDLFNDSEILLNKIKIYNEKITKKLTNLSSYLYETIYPMDTDIYDWTFYFIPYHKKYIGFANADLQNSSAIKISVGDFRLFKNDSSPSFYEGVDVYSGTINDANIIAMRRRYNSKYNTDWKPCLYGVSLDELWVN